MNSIERSRKAEEIVQEWQGPIYGFARRVLGNSEDAADATQEIFLTIFRNINHHDSGRELKPWLFTIAARILQNFLRARTSRQKREAKAMREEAIPSDEDPLERREAIDAVDLELGRLDPSDRMLLTLRYSVGLSPSRIAEVVALPRTTVHSRLDRALGALRKGLAASGICLVTSAVEAAIASLPTPQVPPELSSVILAQAAGAAACGVNSALTLGGIAMFKHVVAAGTVIALFLAGGVYWSGRQIALRAETIAARESEAARSAALEAEQAARENVRLRQELARTKKSLLENSAALSKAATSKTAPGPAPGETGASVPALDPSPGSTGIDWSRFSELFASKLELLTKDHDDQNLTPEEQADLMDLHMEFMRIIAAMKRISGKPLFHEKLLSEFLDAVTAKTLGLSEEQRADLRSTMGELFEAKVKPLNLSRTLPVEQYALRQDLAAGFNEAMEGIIDPTQHDAWSRLEKATDRSFDGDRNVTSLPLEGGTDAPSLGESVARTWTDALGLNEQQAAQATVLADELVDAARQILDSFGMTGNPPRELDRQARQQLDQKLLELQIQKERQLKQGLTPEQWKALETQVPSLLRFHPGRGVRNDKRRGAAL